MHFIFQVLECIKLSEETTTSSSRIFVKIFFQELCEYMGLPKLNARLKDETLQPFFEGLLPRDNPRNTRFAINFFTSIGLGGLTDELREHLKNTPKVIVAQKPDVEPNKSSPSSSSSGSSSSESDSSASDSDSSDSSPESSSEESDSSSTSSQSSASAKDTRKKVQGNARSKEVDKLIRKQQTNDRIQEERRYQETRTERERRSEKHRDKNSRDPNWRDPITKYTSDRGVPFERNSYSRVMSDRNQETHLDLENKHGDPKKKRGERRNSFSENEHRHRNKDSENFRRKDRSKSREKNRKHSSSRSDEDRYQNGAERRWEKSSRYSEQSRESKKNQDQRREKSPAKQKK